MIMYFFFFNDTATTEIYTLSLHDALPIWRGAGAGQQGEKYDGDGRTHCSSLSEVTAAGRSRWRCRPRTGRGTRSEEHTSELQSRQYLVCRLLLEKKKTNIHRLTYRRRSAL